MAFKVKIHSNELKHKRVEAEIRKLALTLPIGSKLPAERDLAVTYKCNFLTVRKALKRLVEDGSIVRRLGSGTFIARHASESELSAHTPGDRIGVLVYQDGDAYANRVLQALAHASMGLRVDLRSVWVRDYGSEALAQVALLKKDGCVAITLPWFPHDRIEEVRGFVLDSPLPVSLPLMIPHLEKNCFEGGDVFGASRMTKTIEDTCKYCHLLGHEYVAFLGPESTHDLILQRKISGYVHYTSRLNLPSICGLVGPGAMAMDKLAEKWKEYRGKIAIVSYDDEHALRFMTSMHKLGLTAPKDFAILGFNDTDGSRFSDPPLSTVQQDYAYIGHWLLKNAQALSRGLVSQSTKTPTLRLLVRQSCGARDKINDAFCAQFKHIEVVAADGKV
jgi:Periplasmic binding protein-like domain/Bacterial regulatory proteins, gntR family